MEFYTGSEVDFYVNDVLKATLSTSIPTSTEGHTEDDVTKNYVLSAIMANDANGHSCHIDTDWLFVQGY